MMRGSCERAWQAAALEDGRLSAAEGASFQRHIATCPACTAELDLLAKLKRAAEALAIVEATPPLAKRRTKNELLRRANERMTAGSRRSWRWLIGAAAIAPAAFAMFIAWPSAELAPLAAPEFHLAASDGAEWSKIERGAVETVVVRRGSVELEVKKLRETQRFLVELPDGELEVKGTRFVVEVEGGRTRAVRVVEGHVELRLHHDIARVLHAGERWPIEPIEPIELIERTADAGVQAPSEERVRRMRPQREVESPPATEETRETPKSTAGGDFKRAMAAFSSGDFGLAEQLFSDFARDHAEDARVEDAMFLSAVARARRGDAEGAKALAREYLRRYPQGLRKSDAEQLAQP